MSGTQSNFYDFPEWIDDGREEFSNSLAGVFGIDDILPCFQGASYQLPSEGHVSVHWSRDLYQFNLDEDSQDLPNENGIFLLEREMDELSDQLEIIPQADLSHSILYTTDIPSDKLGEEQEGVPDRSLTSSMEKQAAYISDILRHRQDLGDEDSPFEMYKVPRKDRTIKAICRMLKAWAIAIGENLRLPEEIVAEVFLELRGCRDIEGIRKVLVKEDRKWLRDELQVLLEDEKFLCYAISENPHITHEDKTLLWEKLPAMKAMVAIPTKVIGSWDPKRIDRSGNFDEAFRLIKEGKATLERISEIVREQYELTKHFFEDVKCSKKNNIYNFWNNAVMKALRQLKRKTINKLIAEEIDEVLAKLKGNRSMQGITSALHGKSALIWHLQTLHEDYSLVELLLQERTNTQMMKSLIDTYPEVLKKLLEI